MLYQNPTNRFLCILWDDNNNNKIKNNKNYNGKNHNNNDNNNNNGNDNDNNNNNNEKDNSDYNYNSITKDKRTFFKWNIAWSGDESRGQCKLCIFVIM